MSDIFLIYTTLYSIFSYIVLFGGIVLTKFFTDKFECRKSYKPAILINMIWFLILFLVFSSLNSLIMGYLMTVGVDLDLIALVGNIISITILIVNFIVIALLINFFYKNGLKDAIFISLAVISIQVFIQIILANVLSIIFNLTTGGYIIFYVFQYV